MQKNINSNFYFIIFNFFQTIFKYGETALHIACEYTNSDVAFLLLKSGANFNQQDIVILFLSCFFQILTHSIFYFKFVELFLENLDFLFGNSTESHRLKRLLHSFTQDLSKNYFIWRFMINR